MRGIEKVKVGAWAAGLLISLLASGVTLDAHAARYNNIIVNVEASSTNLSYGALGAYTFFVKNETNGTINNLRFRAKLIGGATFTDSNPIDGGAVATCTRVDAYNIDCSIFGGVEPFGFSTFGFAFVAPSEGSQIQLEWNVRFGQGAAENFIVSTPGDNPKNVSLLANSKTAVESYIPPADYTGYNLYTGDLLPTGDDPFVVAMRIDPRKATNKIITGSINENSAKYNCPDSHYCAELNVVKRSVDSEGNIVQGKAEYPDDLNQRLEIVLRVSKVPGKKINQVYFSYVPDPDGPKVDIPNCPKRPLDYVPPADVPCLAERVEYTKRTAPIPEMIDIWEFRFWARRNGLIDMGL